MNKQATPALPTLQYISFASQTLAQLLLVLYAATYTLQQSIKMYTQLTIHICILSAILWSHCFLGTFGKYLDLHSPFLAQPDVMEYILFGTISLLLLAILTIPTSPAIQQDVSHLYTKDVKTTIDQDPKSHPLLFGSDASILSILLFGSIYPTISKSASATQLDIQDLPAMGSYLISEATLLNCIDPYKLETTTSMCRGHSSPTPTQLLKTLWKPHFWHLMACKCTTSILGHNHKLIGRHDPLVCCSATLLCPSFLSPEAAARS